MNIDSSGKYLPALVDNKNNLPSQLPLQAACSSIQPLTQPVIWGGQTLTHNSGVFFGTEKEVNAFLEALPIIESLDPDFYSIMKKHIQSKQCIIVAVKDEFQHLTPGELGRISFKGNTPPLPTLFGDPFAVICINIESTLKHEPNLSGVIAHEMQHLENALRRVDTNSRFGGPCNTIEEENALIRKWTDTYKSKPNSTVLSSGPRKYYDEVLKRQNHLEYQINQIEKYKELGNNQRVTQLERAVKSNRESLEAHRRMFAEEISCYHREAIIKDGVDSVKREAPSVHRKISQLERRDHVYLSLDQARHLANGKKASTLIRLMSTIGNGLKKVINTAGQPYIQLPLNIVLSYDSRKEEAITQAVVDGTAEFTLAIAMTRALFCTLGPVPAVVIGVGTMAAEACPNLSKIGEKLPTHQALADSLDLEGLSWFQKNTLLQAADTCKAQVHLLATLQRGLKKINPHRIYEEIKVAGSFIAAENKRRELEEFVFEVCEAQIKWEQQHPDLVAKADHLAKNWTKWPALKSDVETRFGDWTVKNTNDGPQATIKCVLNDPELALFTHIEQLNLYGTSNSNSSESLQDYEDRINSILDQFEISPSSLAEDAPIASSSEDKSTQSKRERFLSTQADQSRQNNIRVTGVSVGAIGAGYQGLNLQLSNGCTLGIGGTIPRAKGRTGILAGTGCLVATLTVPLSKSGLVALCAAGSWATLGAGTVIVAAVTAVKYLLDKRAERTATKISNSLENTGRQIDLLIDGIVPTLSRIHSQYVKGEIDYQDVFQELARQSEHLHKEAIKVEDRASFAYRHGKGKKAKIQRSSLRFINSVSKSNQFAIDDIDSRQKAMEACEIHSHKSPEALLQELNSTPNDGSLCSFYYKLNLRNLLLAKIQDCSNPGEMENFIRELQSVAIYTPGRLQPLSFGSGYGILHKDSLKDLAPVRDKVEEINAALGRGETPIPQLRYLEAVLINAKDKMVKKKAERIGENSTDEYTSRYAEFDKAIDEVRTTITSLENNGNEPIPFDVSAIEYTVSSWPAVVSQVWPKALQIAHLHTDRFGTPAQKGIVHSLSYANQMFPQLLVPSQSLLSRDGKADFWNRYCGKQVRALGLLSGSSTVSLAKVSRLASMSAATLNLLLPQEQQEKYRTQLGALDTSLQALTTASVLFKCLKAVSKGKSIANYSAFLFDLALKPAEWLVEQNIGAIEDEDYYQMWDFLPSLGTLALPPIASIAGLTATFAALCYKDVTGFYTEKVIRALIKNIHIFDGQGNADQVEVRLAKMGRLLKTIPKSDPFSSEFIHNCKYVDPSRFDQTDSPTVQMAKVTLFDQSIQRRMAEKQWDGIVGITNPSPENPAVTHQGYPYRLIPTAALSRLRALLNIYAEHPDHLEQEFQKFTAIVEGYIEEHRTEESLQQHCRALSNELLQIRSLQQVLKANALLAKKVDPSTFCDTFKLMLSTKGACSDVYIEAIRKTARRSFALSAYESENPVTANRFTDLLQSGFDDKPWVNDLDDQSFIFLGLSKLKESKWEEALEFLDHVSDKPNADPLYWHGLFQAFLMKFEGHNFSSDKEMARASLALVYCLRRSLNGLEKQEGDFGTDENDRRLEQLRMQKAAIVQLLSQIDNEQLVDCLKPDEDPQEWIAFFDHVTKWKTVNFSSALGGCASSSQ